MVIIKTGIEKKLISNKSLLNDIDRMAHYKDFESFYEKEERLLYHLYHLEKEEAQKVAKEIVGIMLNRTEIERLKEIQYYFITLSSIVTRYLEKHYLTASQAFAFNQACRMHIEQKLTEEGVANLSAELIELFLYILTEREAPNLKHDTVNKVILHIDEEVESSLTVEGIANKFDVSTSHLSRIFREHSNITLVEYINVRKVEEAQYHLRFSEKKISDISDYFHFCNQSYFTRIFKKYTGETPRRFRHNTESNYFRFRLPKGENQTSDSE